MAIRPKGWEPSRPPLPLEHDAARIHREFDERQQARAAEREKKAAECEKRRIEQAHDAAIIQDQSRQAAKLRDEGLTIQEIAAVLNIGFSTGYDRIGRGKRSVKAWHK